MQEGSHGQRARGLAAGVFCGCFPCFGLQTLLGVGLASLVRGNHLLAAAGSWISNPLTYAPLYWFNDQLGCWLLGSGQGWPSLDVLKGQGLWELGWSFSSRLLLGSTIVGTVASLALVGAPARQKPERQLTDEPPAESSAVAESRAEHQVDVASARLTPLPELLGQCSVLPPLLNCI